MKQYYVYIRVSQRNGTLYIGVTSDLVKRVWQHKSGISPGFTASYDVKLLVYYEKAWKRAWKLDLIDKQNPNWEDLYNSIAT